MALTAVEIFAIDPSGSRIDYGERGIDIPTPILVIGLIISTIGCFFMGNITDKNVKRDAPGMIWLGVLGLIGLLIVFGNIS
ncbi:MAG: hypothetical protein K2L80_07270 [Muribaculaceae bacterium]|nr:hypothetical protein [Muribaculaceae bacterium]